MLKAVSVAGSGLRQEPGIGLAGHVRLAGLNRATDGAYSEACSSSDQRSRLGKIQERAGGSIFFGPTAKRKWSKALSRNMTRSVGLLITRGRGGEMHMTSHPKRPRRKRRVCGAARILGWVEGGASERRGAQIGRDLASACRAIFIQRAAIRSHSSS